MIDETSKEYPSSSALESQPLELYKQMYFRLSPRINRELITKMNTFPFLLMSVRALTISEAEASVSLEEARIETQYHHACLQ